MKKLKNELQNIGEPTFAIIQPAQFLACGKPFTCSCSCKPQKKFDPGDLEKFEDLFLKILLCNIN